MASTLQFLGVFVIELVACVLTLVAEQTRSIAKVVQDAEYNYNFCIYDSSIATKLGIGAAALLLLGQMLRSNQIKGCNSCGFFLSTLCWGAFMMSEAVLLMGAAKNSERTKYRTIFSDDAPNCKTLRKRVFEFGDVLVMISSSLSNFNSIHHYSPNKSTIDMGTYSSLP